MMRKGIFESEEEYRKVIYRTVCVGAKINYAMSIRNATEKGLIKKSEFEIAKEEYYEFYNSRGRDCRLGEMDYRASQYIQELEKKNEV